MPEAREKSVMRSSAAFSIQAAMAHRPSGPLLARLGCVLAALALSVMAPVHETLRAQDRAGETSLPAGPFQFQFTDWEGPALTTWTYVPEGLDPSRAPIVIVMHGARRDADRYRDQWIKPAKAGGFIVVAPAFPKTAFPKAAGYNLGAVFDGSPKEKRDESLWAFSAIEPLFDHVVARVHGQQTRYTIYGHSAGSQFVHRFLFFKPDARVKRYIAANAGWYTFADPTTAFPFGLGGLEISDDQLRGALAKNLVVALGEEDSDPGARLLNTSEGAMAQGPHRFARGQAFYAAARSLAKRRGWPFGWSKRTVPGVGHSNGAMAPNLADLIE